MRLEQYCIFMTLVAGMTIAQSYNVCRTPNYENGICIDIRNCQKLRMFLQGSVNESSIIFLQKSICGFEGLSSKVCCPLDSLIPEDKLPSRTKCGQRKVASFRMIGGDQSELGAWPWMVALGYINLNTKNNTLQWLCSGTLITDSYVLTSAQCVKNRENIRLTTARLGELNLDPNVNDGATPLDVPIEHVIIHEETKEYNSEGIHNDIALLKLNQSVVYTELIQPICLPISSDVQNINLTATMLFVAGWGSTDPTSSLSEPRNTNLMEVQIPITNTTECKQLYEKNNTTFDDRIILCAGYPMGGKDACRGDSGGPLMLPIENQYYLMGIVSYGPKICGEPGHPGVYTRVSYFVDWITTKLRNK